MSTVTVQQALELALGHHQAGRLKEAEVIYRQILSQEPDHAGALHFLGVIAHQLGRHDLARQWIGRAIAIAPDDPAAHSDLGEACRAAGCLDEAMASYREALRLQPDFTPAHYNLGNLLLQLGQPEEAIAAFRRVVELSPTYAQAHFNLGGLYWESGRRDEGVAAWRRALELQPDFAEAYYNLGNACRERGQCEEAVAAYHQARKLGLPYPQLENNLGIALSDLGRMDDAISAYRRALEIEPGHAPACNNLGVALAVQGRLDEAIAAFRRGLELRPDEAGAHSNLIYTLHSHPGEDDRTISQEHERWERRFGEPLGRGIVPHANDRNAERRLRIGYVSPAFRFDSPAFFLAPLLENHDHGRYEIFCYASVRRPDEITARLQKTADGWSDVGALSDADLAERVRADKIDILVDLSMHTTGNRLLAFARKPAPVQVSWLAYPGTTGMSAIDFRITDARIEPSGGDGGVRGGEAVRLPEAWCCYEPLRKFPDVGPLPAEQRGFVTFGSLNQFCKINDDLLRCWAALLGRVSGSRLRMVCPEGEARGRLLATFAAHGVCSERVELVTPCPWVDYVQLFHGIDLALDSFPCNGMTTTCHTLWMGVPVATRRGATAVSRAGDSLLRVIGLPEWVAGNEEEYIRIAAEAAGDLPRLAELRAGLRARMRASPLMDAPRFARDMEAAYRAMWRRWCAETRASKS